MLYPAGPSLIPSTDPHRLRLYDLGVQLLGENQQECPQWLCSMAMYGGGGGGGGGRRPRGGGRANRNFGARDYRKDGGGGGESPNLSVMMCWRLMAICVASRASDGDLLS